MVLCTLQLTAAALNSQNSWCTACFQECRQSFSDPICKSRFLSFSHIISRCIYNKDLFFLQLSCDLRRTAPGKTKRVDFTYCFGGWLVNQPFLFIIRVFHMPKQNSGRYSPAVICFGLPYRTDFLGGLRRIPLVGNIVEGRHLHAVTGQDVYSLLYGDKAATPRQIHHLRQPAHARSGIGLLWCRFLRFPPSFPCAERAVFICRRLRSGRQYSAVIFLPAAH